MAQHPFQDLACPCNVSCNFHFSTDAAWVPASCLQLLRSIRCPPFLQHSVFEILSGCQGVCYFHLLGFKASIDFDEMVAMGFNSNSPSTNQQASLSLPSLAPRHCLCFLPSSVEIACFTRDNDLQDNNWQPPYIPSIQTPRCLTYGTMLASINKRAGLHLQ